MSEAASITVRVPLTIRRQPGRKTVVTPVREGAEAVFPARADPALLKALAWAFRYQRLLDEQDPACPLLLLSAQQSSAKFCLHRGKGGFAPQWPRKRRPEGRLSLKSILCDRNQLPAPLRTVTERRFCDQQEMSLQTATGRSLP